MTRHIFQIMGVHIARVALSDSLRLQFYRRTGSSAGKMVGPVYGRVVASSFGLPSLQFSLREYRFIDDMSCFVLPWYRLTQNLSKHKYLNNQN